MQQGCWPVLAVVSAMAASAAWRLALPIQRERPLFVTHTHTHVTRAQQTPQGCMHGRWSEPPCSSARPSSRPSSRLLAALFAPCHAMDKATMSTHEHTHWCCSSCPLPCAFSFARVFQPAEERHSRMPLFTGTAAHWESRSNTRTTVKALCEGQVVHHNALDDDDARRRTLVCPVAIATTCTRCRRRKQACGTQSPQQSGHARS